MVMTEYTGWVIYEVNLFPVVLEPEESNMEVSASVEFLRHHPMGEGRKEKGELSKYTPPGLFITGVNLSVMAEPS